MNMKLCNVFLTLMISATTLCQGVEKRYSGRSVTLQFDEPIVHTSELHQENPSNVAITGDANHQPEYYWRDQDTLTISFPRGTSIHTKFLLSFKPGQNKYLSGTAITPAAVELTCPMSELSALRIDGTPTAEFCVFPLDCHSKEAIEFSPTSPIHYEFRELKRRNDGTWEQGRAIPAIVEPATLTKIPEREEEDALNALQKQGVDWKNVSGDTPVPGYVIVRAPQGLNTESMWELTITPQYGEDVLLIEQDDDLADEVLRFRPEKELGTGVAQFISQEIDETDPAGVKATMQLAVSFSAPVRKADLAEIFRNTTIRCGEHTAINCSDKAAKTLTIGGKEVLFSLEDNVQEIDEYEPRIPQQGKDESDDCYISYRSEPKVMNMVLSVSNMEPADLDIIIPQGTTAANGLNTACDHLHRISFNPAYPQVDTGALLLPLHGNHHFRLASTNAEQLELKAWHINAEKAHKLMEQIQEVVNYFQSKSAHVERLKHRVAVEKKRESLLPQKEKNSKETQSRLTVEEVKKMSREASMQALLQQLTPFAPHIITLPAPEAPSPLSTQEIAINLDTLTGNNTKPGFYLISITPKASAAVRKQTTSVGVEAGIFETSTYLLLQVTDLFCNAAADKIFLTRLSDGGLVKETGIWDAKGHQHTTNQGLFTIPQEKKAIQPRLAVSGEDYTMITPKGQYYYNSTAEFRQEIFTDRELYRPGDTVNMRGIVRYTSAQGDSSIAPWIKQVEVTVRKPNRDILLQKELTPDEFGAWADSFTLPTGEDDITGNYSISSRVVGEDRATQNTSINCQIFRRDAFETTALLHVDTIAPNSFSATIQATDLNGTPLSNAEVDLRIDCSQELIALTPHEAPSRKLHTKGRTDAQGKLTLRGHICGEFSRFSAGEASIKLSGSVANDRQEYKKIPTTEQAFYATDFVPQLQDTRLMLYKVTEVGKQVLDREQKLRIRIMGETTKEEPLAGGIIITRTPQQCFYEQEVTIPANNHTGYMLPLDSILKNPALQNRELTIELSATDAAGRHLDCVLPYHSWWREPREEEEPMILATYEQGKLLLSVDGYHKGEALLFLQSRKETRMQVVTLKGEDETLSIPLQEKENGKLRVYLQQTTRGKSQLFTDWLADSATCVVPREEMQLQVQLDTPKAPVRPGSELNLSGRITLPDASAAEAVVTLYAVDAGMLSLSHYELPDLEERFGSVYLPTFRINDMHWQGEDMIRMGELELMAPVWQGDIIGAGRYVAMHPSIIKSRFGVYSKFSRTTALGMCADEEMVMGAAAAPCIADRANNSESGAEKATQPYLRTNFAPIAVWQAALHTDAEGRFCTTVKLPDTLTTWRVFAVALDKSGQRFGMAEEKFTANLPVMITPGTPFFMSVGDCLRLPLTISNNTKEDCTWQVSLEGTDAPQSIALQAGTTGTLFFDFTATQEGENTLRWSAVSPSGGDAAEGKFPVRFPSPTLKETHHLVHTAEDAALRLAALPAADLAQASRHNVEIELSASPLLHLAAGMDFVLSYPYGCTEQTASGLLPWIFHNRLAPFSPTMAEKSQAEVNRLITESIANLFKRQQADGGLSYWEEWKTSCLWASAHAAMVFTMAEEQGYPIPAEPMQKLREYLATRTPDELQNLPPYTRYAMGRACGDANLITQALQEALCYEAHTQPRWSWCSPNSVKEDIRFISALRTTPAERHSSFLKWMQSRGHDYRHHTTWQSAWMLVALGEYLRVQPEQTAQATVQLQDGQQMTLSNGITRLVPPTVGKLAELPTTISTLNGTAYLNVKFRALPEKTDYPGLTEKGLQITRVYEKKDAEDNWKPCTDFAVGDVVRITLTCAKAADELQYFVLEDYLPASMEAINPNIPSQAAGLDWMPWSALFDHKEYLSDRVRGFCTRWGGRSILNMSYYARVKRAGIATAPPAQAQLMYEPQIYGLSPSAHITTK